jgi:N utilization substance protein B
MTKRRQAREYALQFLYRIDFVDIAEGGAAHPESIANINEEIAAFWKDSGEEDPDVRSFTENIIMGTIRNLGEIDPLLQKVAAKWSLSRMASIDRNILRFATYEILYRHDIPDAVTINESLEIAKKYSTVDSAAFINGILDRIAKEHGPKGPKA